MSAPDFLFDGGSGDITLILAHGAGAPMDSPFMNAMARGLAECGIRVARFEFPYMRSRRDGRRRPPDREPVLLQSWRDAVAVIGGVGGADRVVIGGKSMGGRMASLVADELGVRGLVCLGYPFHPPGKPESLRVRHLEPLRTPALIVQGTRDALGSREEVEGNILSMLSPAIRLVWLEDGDHSFKPRVSSGHTEKGHLAAAVEAVAEFVKGC
jgi:predicted alpha/beta-hydrolase family hydrolase